MGQYYSCGLSLCSFLFSISMFFADDTSGNIGTWDYGTEISLLVGFKALSIAFINWVRNWDWKKHARLMQGFGKTLILEVEFGQLHYAIYETESHFSLVQ